MLKNHNRDQAGIKRLLIIQGALNPLDTLDTGGMNWRRVYRYLSTSQYSFARVERIRINLQDEPQSQSSTIEAEMINGSFLHLSGLTHKKAWQQYSAEELLAFFKNPPLPTGNQA